VDYETLRLMKKAGCRLLCVGFESGDQQILDNIQKSMTLDKIRQFVKDARRAGVLVHGCFMVGNRGETRQTLKTTLAFAKELSPDTAQFFPIMVYPGTEDYRYFEERGWIVTRDFRKWLTGEGLHSSVVSRPDIAYEELVAFCDNARREFYLRPGYLFAKALQAVSNPGEIKRLLKGFFSLLRYLFKPSIQKSTTP
jgi:anaerobic magnesium-protoporphyrin IX monomethyl ester cyclase